MEQKNISINLNGSLNSKMCNYMIAALSFLALLFMLVLPVLSVAKEELLNQILNDDNIKESFGIGKVLGETSHGLLGIFMFISFAGSALMLVKALSGKICVSLPIIVFISTLFIGFCAPNGAKLGVGSIINLIIFGLCILLAIASSLLTNDKKEEKNSKEIKFY